MICDMSDVTMKQGNEEEKIPTTLAPTPSAAHNPNPNKTGNGGEFKAKKSTTMSNISKMSKIKDAFDN